MTFTQGDSLDKEAEVSSADKAEIKNNANSETSKATKPHNVSSHTQPQLDRPSLNDLIKDSKNDEAAKIKEEIDNLRKERSKVILKIKEARRRLGYKEEEAVALTQLVTMNKEKDKDGELSKRYNYLRRMKNRLEFRISTEASSLSKEKEIIRQIGEINQELQQLGASVRMDRKLGLVKGDIVEAKAKLTELEPKIVEMDTKLDLMYSELRKKLGITKKPAAPIEQRKFKPRERAPREQPSQEINLEDIVVIKKK